MRPATSSSRGPTSVPGWAVLDVGPQSVAIPQGEVHRVELAADLVRTSSGEEAGVGCLKGEDDSYWPAYSLDEALGLEEPAVPERRLCVFVVLKDAICGILCDNVRFLDSDDNLSIRPVPGCMPCLGSFARGLASLKGGVVLVTDSEVLAEHIGCLPERLHGNETG